MPPVTQHTTAKGDLAISENIDIGTTSSTFGPELLPSVIGIMARHNSTPATTNKVLSLGEARFNRNCPTNNPLSATALYSARILPRVALLELSDSQLSIAVKAQALQKPITTRIAPHNSGSESKLLIKILTAASATQPANTRTCPARLIKYLL